MQTLDLCDQGSLEFQVQGPECVDTQAQEEIMVKVQGGSECAVQGQTDNSKEWNHASI